MRKEIFYRTLKTNNTNMNLYEFCGLAIEDLCYYLYEIGVEKKISTYIETLLIIVMALAKNLMKFKEENDYLFIIKII